MRHRRHLRAPRSGQAVLPRALRLAASRAGIRGHRRRRGPDAHAPRGHGARRRRLLARGDRRAPGPDRHRPRALLDRRRLEPGERPALPAAAPSRADRGRATTATWSTPRPSGPSSRATAPSSRRRPTPRSCSTWSRARASRTSSMRSSTRSARCGARTRSCSSCRGASSRSGTRWGSARCRSDGSTAPRSSRARSCAFDLLGAEKVRDLERGEVVVIDVGGVHSFKPFAATRPAPCAFEHVYFARPDSTIFGQSVQAVRKRLGRAAVEGAAGRRRSHRPRARLGDVRGAGLCRAPRRSRSSSGWCATTTSDGRSSSPRSRSGTSACASKLNPVRETLAGKRIALIDDSLVRGTTSQKIVQMCRGCGREGSAPAHLVPADDRPLLLRDRHAAARRADRVEEVRRADPAVRRRGLARLPEPRRG